MPFYETVYVSRQELTKKQVDDLTESFCKIIKDGGGKIHKTENWGLRTFAYRINKSRKGNYVLIETDTPPEALIEMERNMRLNEEVMRFMSVREQALSEGPSIMMKKGSDHDSRDSRDSRPSPRDNNSTPEQKTEEAA